MGVIRKLVLGRWAAKWLLRGSPLAVAAKLAGVAVYSAWRWRRSHAPDPTASREIEADYEVIDGEPAHGAAEPAPELSGTTDPDDRPSTRSDIDPNPGAGDDAR